MPAPGRSPIHDLIIAYKTTVQDILGTHLCLYAESFYYLKHDTSMSQLRMSCHSFILMGEINSVLLKYTTYIHAFGARCLKLAL